MQGHKLEKKTSKQKQSFRQDDVVAKADAGTVKRLLGRG
jgi:ribosomal protein L35